MSSINIDELISNQILEDTRAVIVHYNSNIEDCFIHLND